MDFIVKTLGNMDFIVKTLGNWLQDITHLGSSGPGARAQWAAGKCLEVGLVELKR